MSIKLKALGLAVFAALAVGAVGVVSATAETGGHFTSTASWTTISGVQEGTLGENELTDTGSGESITCTTATYAASVGATTVESIEATPTYAGCSTTAGFTLHVAMNGCKFLFTIGKDMKKDQTIHLVCTGANEVTTTITTFVGNCVIHIHPQTPTTGGVVYTNDPLANNKKGLTLNITAEGITQNKTQTGFGCAGSTGADNKSDIKGKITVTGKDTTGAVVDIAATGA